MKKSLILLLFVLIAMQAYAQNLKPENDTAQLKQIVRILQNIREAINDIDQTVDADTIGEIKVITDKTVLIRQQKDILWQVEKKTGTYLTKQVQAYVKFSGRFCDKADLFVNAKQYYPAQIAGLQDDLNLYREETSELYQYIISLTPDQSIVKAINDLKEITNKLTIDVDKISMVTNNVNENVKKMDSHVSVLDNQVNNLSNSVNLVSIKIAGVNKKADTIRDTVKAISRATKKIDTANRKIDTATKKIDTASKAIKAILKPLPAPKGIISITGYDNNVFGISYFFTVSRSTDAIYRSEGDVSQHIGAQFVFPASSVTAKDPGVFVMYALRDKKLLLQAGIGYLNNGKPQNVSWQCGLLYFPQKFGIGLSWSPIMNTGLQLAFKF